MESYSPFSVNGLFDNLHIISRTVKSQIILDFIFLQHIYRI